MSRIYVLVCRSDDSAGAQMTELACFDLPEIDVTRLQPETALVELEASTCEIGNAVLRQVRQARRDTITTEAGSAIGAGGTSCLYSPPVDPKACAR